MVRIFILLLISCCLAQHSYLYAQLKTEKDLFAPSWVKNRPANRLYYVGIGVASKNLPNYTAKAKQNALKDLSSDIAVQVKAKSSYKKSETTEKGSQEKFFSNTEVQSQEDFKDYELVDSYSDKDFFWVYYRLSKEVYLENKRKEREKVIASASSFFQQAELSLNKGNISNALEFYFKSLEKLGSYISEEIYIRTSDLEKISVAKVISKIKNIANSIVIQSDDTLYTINKQNPTQSIGGTLEFHPKGYDSTITYNFSALPLYYRFNNTNKDKKKYISTNGAGNFAILLKHSPILQKNDFLEICLDLNKYIHTDLLKNTFRTYAHCNKAMITSEQVKAFYSFTVRQFGKRRDIVKPIIPVLNFLGNYFHTVKKESDANVIIKILLEISHGDTIKSGIKALTFINGNLSLLITDINTQKILYSNGIKEVSQVMLGASSYDKLYQKIKKQLVKELEDEIAEIQLY